MPTALANVAAAITAGFKQITTDRGATAPAATRYEVTLEKRLVGAAGQGAEYFRAFGRGSSQANAETAALAALNYQRNHRYGFDAAGGSKSNLGVALTNDVT